MQCKMLALITCAILCAFLHSAAGRAVEFAYLGCFVDGSPRDLNGLYGVSRIGPFGVGSSTASNSTAMSREYCADVCSLGGFAYFGVQAGVQCFCGNSYGSHGAVAESNCGSTCSGNAAQKCGGSWRNSVFALTYLNNFFLEEVTTSLTVVSNGLTSWSSAARTDIECMSFCLSNSLCQAVIFSKQQRLCHLLRFAYPPSSLSSIDGDFFVRG